MQNKLIPLALAAVLLLSIGMRLPFLEREWGLDEPHTIRFITAPFEGMLENVASDSRMPVYFFLLWGADSLLHPGEGLRLISVMFGVLSVGAAFLLGREIFSEKIGLAAAFLLALSPFHIAYSQYLREYSLLIFLFILSTLFLQHVLVRNHKKHWFLLATSNTLLLLTHFLSFVFILAQFAVIITLRRGLVKRFVLQGIAVLLISVPWLLFLAQHAALKDYGGVFDFNPARMVYALYKISFGANISSLLGWSTGLLVAAALFFSVTLIASFWFFYKKQQRAGTFLFVQLLLPIVILFAVSAAMNVFSYRYLSPLLGVYVVIIAGWFGGIRDKRAQLLLLAGFVCLYLLADVYYFSVITLPDWPIRFGI